MYPSRKDTPVLRNLSLIARAGQTTALVGKSTCISLFLRYYEPSSGRITINGRPITNYNVQQLRQTIGVVNQEPILFGMSIYENIRFGKVNATREEIEQAARESNAHHFIMQLPNKYETLVGERGIQLSGGEKQRIALARALVKQPTFLLLDEATSALDNISDKIVQDALDRACKGRTTIVIAHRLSTIQNTNQIYVLDNGSVIEQGTHETLMAEEGGKYQSMVKRQQMERFDDDKDDMMSMENVTEEDEKLIIEHTRSLSDRQTIHVNKYTSFAISGSKLTQRIRSKAFACLLRQEIAYFDRPENSSGAICARLSSDASAIQEMAGTRLGAICEALSMTFFGLLLGFLINWQLTMIAFCPLSILAAVTYGEMQVRLWMNQQSNQIVEQASTIDFRGEIKLDQVKFIYPIRPTSIILNKLQLNIRSGQRVALIGMLELNVSVECSLGNIIRTGTSGCGKTTVIQLLERFYNVTQGQLFLDGIDIRQLNLQWVRSQFGLVSQEPILFDLTIAENITYGLENVSIEDIISAAKRANIHQFIEQLPQGYETRVGLKGSFLSGGEKQRIAIARVLIRRPKVLLLDEATSAMDSHNEQLVQEVLEQAQTEDSSRTSLVIAHRLSTIRSCDLICVLDGGHIVESGTHTELMQQRGAYYKMLAQNNSK
ncbi:unnamed protein product [Rotaria sp. Silwood1]|nr:unnamed protein product [Rotaria sp. Silwood1]